MLGNRSFHFPKCPSLVPTQLSYAYSGVILNSNFWNISETSHSRESSQTYAKAELKCDGIISNALVSTWRWVIGCNHLPCVLDLIKIVLPFFTSASKTSHISLDYFQVAEEKLSFGSCNPFLAQNRFRKKSFKVQKSRPVKGLIQLFENSSP